MGVSSPTVRDFRPNSWGPGGSLGGDAGPKARGPPPSGYRVVLYNAIIQISSQSESVAARSPGHVLPRRSIIVLDLRLLCALPFYVDPPFGPRYPPESRAAKSLASSCAITARCDVVAQSLPAFSSLA